MRTAPAEKPPDERVMLQPAEMKEAFASEYPADNEIEQDAENREQGIALLGTI